MTTEELESWAADFAAFCARFADVFGRKEPRALLAQLASPYHALNDGTRLARRHPLASDGGKRRAELFLAALTVPEVRRLLDVALPLP